MFKSTWLFLVNSVLIYEVSCKLCSWSDSLLFVIESNYFPVRQTYNQWRRGESMDRGNKLYSDMNEFPHLEARSSFIYIAFYLQFISVQLLLQIKGGKRSKMSYLWLVRLLWINTVKTFIWLPKFRKLWSLLWRGMRGKEGWRLIK